MRCSSSTATPYQSEDLKTSTPAEAIWDNLESFGLNIKQDAEKQAHVENIVQLCRFLLREANPYHFGNVGARHMPKYVVGHHRGAKNAHPQRRWNDPAIDATENLFETFDCGDLPRGREKDAPHSIQHPRETCDVRMRVGKDGTLENDFYVAAHNLSDVKLTILKATYVPTNRKFWT